VTYDPSTQINTFAKPSVEPINLQNQESFASTGESGVVDPFASISPASTSIPLPTLYGTASQNNGVFIPDTAQVHNIDSQNASYVTPIGTTIGEQPTLPTAALDPFTASGAAKETTSNDQFIGSLSMNGINSSNDVTQSYPNSNVVPKGTTFGEKQTLPTPALDPFTAIGIAKETANNDQFIGSLSTNGINASNVATQSYPKDNANLAEDGFSDDDFGDFCDAPSNSNERLPDAEFTNGTMSNNMKGSVITDAFSIFE